MNAQPIPDYEPNEAQSLGDLKSLAHRQAVVLFHQAKALLVQRAINANGNRLVAPSRDIPRTM